MASKKNDKVEAKKSDGRNALPIVAAAVVALSIVTVVATNGRGGENSEKKDEGPLKVAEGESLVIPVSEITDEASFYPVNVDGEDMEVLAVRASDGTVRTAFNTCQSCYTSGAGFYRFEEGELVCNNCGFHFSPDEVEVASGGCNPWPIFEDSKVVSGENIELTYDFLSESKGIFANWKTAVR